LKRQQWITAAIGICLVVIIYFFGRTVPVKTAASVGAPESAVMQISADTLIAHAKEQLSTEQVMRLNELENSISRGDVKNQQLEVYHQLSHFWKDTAKLFEPYAWYEAEAARLENSEKSLTFAAHLLLNNLQGEGNPALKQWKATQAKDLFERSLKINPANDSSAVGLGACYLFGNIAENPMEGIIKVKNVLDKDSTNIFALMTLGHGSILSGQSDKAIARFEQVNRLQPQNLEAILSLADIYEKNGNNDLAITWYKKSLPLIAIPALSAEVERRINDLNKKQ
jgi:tetratricopeptide (TPR) repeat protein